MPKAPVCKLCQKAHWSYEPHGPTAEAPEYVKKMAAINSPQGAINTSPAINEERLTDAINKGVPAINSSPSRAETSSGKVASRKVGERGLSPRTPNRRSRESYNEYMRGYMARRRKA